MAAPSAANRGGGVDDFGAIALGFGSRKKKNFESC
ncbi:hypothetical protein COLO4_20951 [Corchorus olitorius]|uniref:Uncharacterized protein n=1 Tax=Corchorus olitorius TaxID=93759 RepID=A0A1R3IVZ6_9ROSI|nr:hypothetical protein COLO4_20951 [Corchorus olitorius]